MVKYFQNEDRRLVEADNQDNPVIVYANPSDNECYHTLPIASKCILDNPGPRVDFCYHFQLVLALQTLVISNNNILIIFSLFLLLRGYSI
jgi:hypothetical protein